MGFAFDAFPVVVGPGGRASFQRREAGEVEDPQQPPVGEPVRRLIDREISTSGAEELRGEHGSEAGHAQHGPRVPVFGDFLTDQRIELCQLEAWWTIRPGI